MSALLSAIGAFIGAIFAKLLPSIGEEIRKNNTVEQIGADDETMADIDDHISSGVDMHGVRLDEAGDNSTP